MTRTATPFSTLSVFALGALAVAAGCSRQAAPVHAAARTIPGEGPAFAADSEGAKVAESAPSPAAAPAAPAAASRDASPESGAAKRAYEPAPVPEQRPGLGTEWGETRESRVSSARFERADENTPLSTSSFFYNDETGVRAMLGSGYWNLRSDGVSAARGAVVIELVDESGAPLPTFSTGSKSYVIGNDGARYAIRISNHTGARFEAVATVDGLDVIDGQPGSFEKRGYLVGPWATLEIDGFRRSEDEVAAFRFGRVRDSYAARRGNDRNVGVIGVALFHERGSTWPWSRRELERRNSADAFPGRFAPAP